MFGTNVRCDLTADFSGGAVLSENTDAEDSVSASDQALGQGVPNDARGKYISPFMDLTVIGGVIKRYAYYLVPFIVAENPDISAREAVALSQKMMYGRKWECFLFELSFIGWDILSILTLRISGVFFHIRIRWRHLESIMPNCVRLRSKIGFREVKDLMTVIF